RSKFNKLILSDIAIHLVFTSIYTGQIGNLIGIAPFAGIGQNNENIGVNELNAQQLMNHYKIPVARDLAKKTQNDITPANILKNSEKLDNLELKDNFDILATYYDEISCDNT
ncbi:5003_t:CDS:2, partial [Racocetra fulgida]